eukprot:gene7212-9233_t
MAKAKDSETGREAPKEAAKKTSFDPHEKKDDDDLGADSKFDDSHCSATGSKQDSKVEEALSDDEILEKLQRFFFEDERFGQRLEEFVHARCGEFDLDNDEYKLQYTTLYDEYKSLFESMLESFIEGDLKCSINDVYRALKAADDKSTANPNSLDAFFAQVLIASTDFEVFMSMLRDAARQHSRK